MDNLNLLADAATSFFNTTGELQANSQAALVDRLLDEWNHLHSKASITPREHVPDVLLTVLVRLFDSPPNSPISPEDLPIIMTACAVIDYKRTGTGSSNWSTTRVFLTHLKGAWREARDQSQSRSPVSDDILCPFAGQVPPCNIDFTSGNLLHPLNALLKTDIVVIDMLWLGVGPHDGYPRCASLAEYGGMRQGHPNFPWQQHPLIWQSTLTFGLLEAAMEVNIPESFLLETCSDGPLVVSGRRLSMLIFDLQLRLTFARVVDEVLHRDWKARIATVLEEARAIMDDELAYSHLVRAGFWQVEVDKQVCSIATIIEALGHASDVFLHATSNSSSQCVNRARFVHAVKLGNARWCPFAVGALATSLSVQNHATKVRPFVRKELGEHAECDSSHCSIHNIDSNTYVAQHATHDCTCGFVAPPLERVIALLSSGDIPIIVPHGDGTLSVRSASAGPYVAISHVWVDGLGSTTEEGLPRCQITRMASLTAQLVPQGAFWQDGLCVPSDRPMRKQAIALMAKTYAGAHKVLVIDAGIRTLRVNVTSLEEVLLRIATSGWMQRIWTLQEGLLARELYFEFADGIIRAEALKDLHTSAVHPLFLAFNPIVSALLDALLFVRGRDGEDRTKYTFPELLRLMHHRTTSKPEDETLAIAGLVGVDAGELVSLPTAEERMALFLQRIKCVPRSIVAAAGKKLTKPGFRWASSTMVAGINLSSICDATCTESGLRATYSILSFPEMDLPKPYGHKVYIHVPATGQYYEVLAAAQTDHEDYCRCNAVLLTGPDILPKQLEAFPCVAVMIESSGADGGGTTVYTCRYVNGHSLICQGDSVEPVVALLARGNISHSIVEGTFTINATITVT